jgi:hypothetical protein
MTLSTDKLPVYFPALVLVDALLLMYVAGSGFQYEQRPWTLYLMIPAAILLVVAFALFLLHQWRANLFLLSGILMALPYFATVYVKVLIRLVSGEPLVFTATVLSAIALMFIWTVAMATGFRK